MSVFLLQKNTELGLVSLLALLNVYAEAQTQPKPFLIKDGIKIIL
jgi:hypothetical protein